MLDPSYRTISEKWSDVSFKPCCLCEEGTCCLCCKIKFPERQGLKFIKLSIKAQDPACWRCFSWFVGAAHVQMKHSYANEVKLTDVDRRRDVHGVGWIFCSSVLFSWKLSIFWSLCLLCNGHIEASPLNLILILRVRSFLNPPNRGYSHELCLAYFLLWLIFSPLIENVSSF